MIFDFLLMGGTSALFIFYLISGDSSFLRIFLVFSLVIIIRMIQNKITYDKFFEPFFMVYD